MRGAARFAAALLLCALLFTWLPAARADCDPVTCSEDPSAAPPCTPYTCQGEVGAEECLPAPVSGCCTTAATCDDSNACTTDDCDTESNTCTNVQKNCDDSESCTTDSCNPTTGDCQNPWQMGCCHVASCADTDTCTQDQCDPNGFGTCIHPHIDYCCYESCADTDNCTADSCTQSTSTCVHTHIDYCCNPPCDDGRNCTVDVCSIDGNCTSTVSCDDNKFCTTDDCDASGNCRHTPIPNCCTIAGDCSNVDPCMDPSCVNNQCVLTPKVNCCRNDSECIAPDACSIPQCASHVCVYPQISGCCTADGQCDDNNMCTSNKCTGNVCTFPTTTGTCSDGNICTTDICNSNNTCSNPSIPNCCRTSSDCHDNNACTDNVCNTVTNTCSFVPITGCCRNAVDCADANPCTNDTCVGSGASARCAHTPITGCCLSNDECDDHLACTTDTCTSGRVCSNQYICQCRINSDCVDNANACNIGKCTSSFSCAFSVDPTCCTVDTQCTTQNPCERVGCSPTRHVCEVTDVVCVCGDGLCEQELGELCSTCPDDCGQCEFLVQDAYMDVINVNVSGGSSQVLLLSGNPFLANEGSGLFVVLEFDLLPLLQAARAGILVTNTKSVRLTLTLAAVPQFGLKSLAPQLYLVDPSFEWGENNASFAEIGEPMLRNSTWLYEVPAATWINLNDSIVSNVSAGSNSSTGGDDDDGLAERLMMSARDSTEAPLNDSVLANPPRVNWDISDLVRTVLAEEQSKLTLLVSWDSTTAPLLQVVSRESIMYAGMQASVQLFSEPSKSRSGGGGKRGSVVGPVVGAILGGGGGLLLLMGCCLVLVVLVALLVAGALLVVRRRNEKRSGGAFGTGSGSWGSGSGSGSRGGRGVREEMLRMMQVSEEIPFEDLTLEKLLGSGAAGDVYLARWSQGKVKVEVAVKRTTDHPADREAFVREVQLVKKLQHPNIVQFLGVSFHGDDLLLVTELMKGGSLEHLLHGRGGRKEQSRAIPFHKALRYALDAARGLAFLHFSQPVVIHRDIKPGNLLISESDNVKISDFGISRFLTEMTNTEVGSPAYMAPEMLRNEPYSTSIDVYAFGLTCCEMVTGKRPFNDVPATQVVMHVAIKHERPTLPDASLCPASFIQLITDCWNDLPAERPAMNVIVERLIAIADEQAGVGGGKRGSASRSSSSSSSSSSRPVVMAPPHAVASASRSASSASSSSSTSGDSDGSEIEIRS